MLLVLCFHLMYQIESTSSCCYFHTAAGICHDEALVNRGKGGGHINTQLFIKETEKVCRM